jgi:superfamily II DNA or RNA helicase
MGLAALKQPPREAIHGVHTDGFRLGLQTVFAPWLSDFFRESSGAWHHQARMWVFPRSAINGVFAQRLATEAPSGVVLTVAKTLELIKQALSCPEPDLFAEGLDVQLFPVTDGGTALHYKRDALLDQALQAIGGKTLQGRTGWFVELSVDDVLAELAARAGIHRDFVYVHAGEMVLAETGGGVLEDRPTLALGVSKIEERHATVDAESTGSVLSVALTPMVKYPVDERVLEHIVDRHALYDFQRDGVAHLLSVSGGLEADDMGLGKSRQLISACCCIEGEGAVLIVCPAPLLINWQREINGVEPTHRVGIVGEHDDWHTADWVVVNYERLGAIVQALNEKRIRFRAMGVDEAHNLKEPTSGRTRNAFLIGAHIARRFLLTATPVLNRMQELHCLLRLTGHALGMLPVGDFVKEYGSSPELRQALRERLKEWMIRRPKAVVKGLQGKSHQLQYVSLRAEEQRHYRQILADDQKVALVKVGELRQLLERSKTEWIIETIQGMASDDKVIVSCEHLEVVPLIADALNAAGIRTVTYTGKQSKNARQAAVDDFQQDSTVRVFVCMRKAAGVGLTLTAANYVILVSLPWNAGLRRQMEDRAYRNGQTRHVTVLIPIVPGTIDERVLDLNKYKESIEQDLLQDEDEREPNPLDILGATAHA